MAKCRGCGASIVWLQTANGKMIPCDPNPIGYREREGARGKILTRAGKIVSCDFTNNPGVETGYMPHFATCPKAADFKKARK
jgi:ssDNA-binding Zn-finger/Zn-ribbon topoisomerase 1